jgi:hypothetical protein
MMRRDNMYNNKQIIVGMASVPWRVATAELVVRSLIKQVDAFHIYLNNYDEVPGFLKGECPFLQKDALRKIHIHRSQETGDLKSLGKFYGAQFYKEGVYLSVDDDILYPPNYAQRMAEKLSRYKGKVLVCVHGAKMKRPVNSYYGDMRTVRFELPTNKDQVVEIAGTGTLAYDLENFTLPVFEGMCYDDPQVAAQAKRLNMPIVAIARPEKWLTNIDLFYSKSIHGANRLKLDKKVTAFVKANIE